MADIDPASLSLEDLRIHLFSSADEDILEAYAIDDKGNLKDRDSLEEGFRIKNRYGTLSRERLLEMNANWKKRMEEMEGYLPTQGADENEGSGDEHIRKIRKLRQREWDEPDDTEPEDEPLWSDEELEEDEDEAKEERKRPRRWIRRKPDSVRTCAAFVGESVQTMRLFALDHSGGHGFAEITLDSTGKPRTKLELMCRAMDAVLENDGRSWNFLDKPRRKVRSWFRRKTEDELRILAATSEYETLHGLSPVFEADGTPANKDTLVDFLGSHFVPERLLKRLDAQKAFWQQEAQRLESKIQDLVAKKEGRGGGGLLEDWCSDIFKEEEEGEGEDKARALARRIGQVMGGKRFGPAERNELDQRSRDLKGVDEEFEKVLGRVYPREDSERSDELGHEAVRLASIRGTHARRIKELEDQADLLALAFKVLLKPSGKVRTDGKELCAALILTGGLKSFGFSSPSSSSDTRKKDEIWPLTLLDCQAMSTAGIRAWYVVNVEGIRILDIFKRGTTPKDCRSFLQRMYYSSGNLSKQDYEAKYKQFKKSQTPLLWRSEKAIFFVNDGKIFAHLEFPEELNRDPKLKQSLEKAFKRARILSPSTPSTKTQTNKKKRKSAYSS